MEQIQRIKNYIKVWSPTYDDVLLELDIKEAIQRICNYINDDTFPEALEINLAKELHKAYVLEIPSNAISIKESETTVQLAVKPVDYDEIVSNLKKTLFRFRKLK